MAIISPFKAWHPSPASVQSVSSVPYDVINTREAQEIAGDNPDSFLHVTRPEIDLPKGIKLDDDRVYQKGADNLKELMKSGALEQQQQPSLYIYQLEWNDNSQTGIFGCVSVDEYQDETILKHELTRPAKEEDRTRHILTQQAHAEPVMLTYKDQPEINDRIEAVTKNSEALYNFTADDGVVHKLWLVEDTDALVQAFSPLEHLYIADGHHRCKSAANAAEYMRKQAENYTGDEPFNYFPAVIFPMSEMNVLAYNRIIHHIPDDFEQSLKQKFTVQKIDDPTPEHKGEICLYLEQEWVQLSLPGAQNPSAVEELDVYRLQTYLLEPMLDITDPRRDENISFVGGIHGTSRLEKEVDNGNAELAISMYPTSIEELVQVSDEKGLMPPKSTWFEPKLRSGLLVHSF